MFEPENLNRQNGSSVATLGHNKAAVIGDLIRGINPTAVVDVYETGVNQENISGFLDQADVLVDETEFTLPHLPSASPARRATWAYPSLPVSTSDLAAR